MTEFSKPLVLITRAKDDAGDLATGLRALGFSSLSLPMLEIVESGQALPALEGFSGLVFTSRQGVHHFSKLSPERKLAVFAVGDATAEEAKTAGFLQVISAAGDGADLARLISGKIVPGNKLLHPGGEERALDLSEKIAGIAITAVNLYRAKPSTEFPEEIRREFESGRIGYVLFFSPATARNFVTLISGAGLEKLMRGVVAVCLSRMVAEAAGLLPWGRLLVAKKPDKKSLLEMLMTDSEQNVQRKEFPAEPVINAFGGIRPLATRLGLTASTVQGWKIRGLIPATRLYDVVRAANEDGVEIKGIQDMLRSLGKEGQPFDEKRETDERRKREDRRKQNVPVVNDRRVADNRRSGLDRRHEEYLAHQKAQQKKIQQARMAFFDHTTVTVAFVFIAVLFAGGLLLAPEFYKLKQKAGHVDQLETKIAAMNQRLEKIKEDQSNFSGNLNTQIEALAKGTDSMMENIAKLTAGDNGNWQARLIDLEGRVSNLGGVVVRADSLKQATSGPESYGQMLGLLRQAITNTGGDALKLNAEVGKASQQNPALAGLLGGVDARDVGSAAMLIALNQFRDNVGTGRPFADDLATMKTLMGASPEMQKSLDNLAPYADHGILSTEALGTEFRGLAGDIVMAKLTGRENLSVKERALQRFSGLVKIRKVGDIEGHDTDAIVARAQKMLDGGDVPGAIAELQTLEGASAQKAAPWLEKAQARSAADDTSSILSRYIMAQVASGSGPGAAIDSNMLQLILSGHPIDAILPKKQVPIISNSSGSGGAYPSVGSGSSGGGMTLPDIGGQ